MRSDDLTNNNWAFVGEQPLYHNDLVREYHVGTEVEVTVEDEIVKRGLIQFYAHIRRV